MGAIDWNLRNFHGYETRRGSTYNAYLIADEKTVLIDTVGGFLPYLRGLAPRKRLGFAFGSYRRDAQRDEI